MPGDLGGVQRGPLIQEDPEDIMGVAHDGGKGGWLLRDGVPGSVRGDAARSAINHHI